MSEHISSLPVAMNSFKILSVSFPAFNVLYRNRTFHEYNTCKNRKTISADRERICARSPKVVQVINKVNVETNIRK